MTKIFISYRRDDSADVVGRIRENLTPPLGNFPPEDVFVDVDGIPLGVNVRRYIEERVSQCAVMLVVIGREWLTITDRNGNRRLDAPNDYVRIEVETALRRDIPIIPLLVSGAEMPTVDLPDAIATLADYNGTYIRRDPDFKTDIARLVQGLERHLLPTAPKPAAPPQEKPVTKLEPAPAKPATLKHAESDPFSPPVPVPIRRELPAVDYSRFQLLKTLEGHTHRVTSCVFSPDGRILASASWDKTVRLWDATDGKLSLIHTLIGHENSLFGCNFSPDGRTLASSSSDKTVRLWDMSSSKPALTATLEGHTEVVTSCAFSPNGRTLASASWDKTVRLWDVSSSESVSIATLEGHTSSVQSCAFSPDGRLLASASNDKTICLWDVSQRTPTLLYRLQNEGKSEKCAFSPDGHIFAVSSYSKIFFWNVMKQAPTVVQELKAASSPSSVSDFAFSPNGHTIAILSLMPLDKSIVSLWDFSQNKPSRIKALEGHQHVVNACAFSPDGRTLATASSDKTIKIWGVPN